MAAIREAGRQDAPLLLGLIRESFETLYRRVGLTPANFSRHAAHMGTDWVLEQMDGGNRFFILEDLGVPCGCVALRPAQAGAVELRRLAVLPAHRRRGCGQALVAHVVAEARRLGARRVTLGLWATAPELRRWYERRGFTITETKTYPDLPLAVTHMAMDL
ncbi:MAG: GNAT family N-acetyltransferase [Planctomycetes bacterium]|nr:GNAT family N-acetyltransferase [Planctomycetota bacterium]